VIHHFLVFDVYVGGMAVEEQHVVPIRLGVPTDGFCCGGYIDRAGESYVRPVLIQKDRPAGAFLGQDSDNAVEEFHPAGIRQAHE